MEKNEIKSNATIHNLIILDKSGSMMSIASAAVAGVNETIGTIKAAYLKNPDVKQTITLVAFCGCELRYIFNRVPILEAKMLTEDDYQPCCNTPLYDAIGSGVNRLKRETEGDEAAYSVTVITDGYENSSTEYDGKAIKALVESLKAKGWLFAYIGAEHDVEKVAFSLSIDNTMRFERNLQSARRMFARQGKARSKWLGKMFCCFGAASDDRERLMSEANENYFSDIDE